jgi:hypothetical protein
MWLFLIGRTIAIETSHHFDVGLSFSSKNVSFRFEFEVLLRVRRIMRHYLKNTPPRLIVV